jgi:uncharacterized OB-fold protein
MMTEEREVTSASFYQFLAEKKLMASRCKNCQQLYLPPHAICSKCHGGDMEWVEMKGDGKLAAYTSICVGPTCTLEEGYDRNNPYVVGVVQLEECPKVSGRVEGLDARKPVEFRAQDEGKNCYVAFKAK